MFKVKNTDNGLMSWILFQLPLICLKSTTETLEISNDISDVFLVFLLLTLNIFHTLILDQACNFNDF